MRSLTRARSLLGRLGSRRGKALIALSGLLAVTVAGTTVAGFTDRSTLSLGDAGLGNPNKFTVEVYNEASSTWVETTDAAASATFANNGKKINTKAGSNKAQSLEANYTATFTAKFRLKAGSPKGRIIPQVVPDSLGNAPDCNASGAKPAFCYMRFTATVGGKNINRRTAESLNTSLRGASYKVVPTPGEEQEIKFTVWFDESIMSDPDVASMRGQNAAFGIRFDAESSIAP